MERRTFKRRSQRTLRSSWTWPLRAMLMPTKAAALTAMPRASASMHILMLCWWMLQSGRAVWAYPPSSTVPTTYRTVPLIGTYQPYRVALQPTNQPADCVHSNVSNAANALAIRHDYQVDVSLRPVFEDTVQA
eukprot:366270-Chlamydomonas_euryale.AAC.1